MATDRDHRAAGRAAKQSGGEFEDELEHENGDYAAQGLAFLTRAHPPVVGPPDRLRRAGSGGVDFVGVACGLPVMFDAKSRQNAASYRQDERDMHQLEELLANHRAGGLSFLLIRDPALSRVYLLTIPHIVRLHRGEPVALRRALNAIGLSGVAHVPCVQRSPREQLVALALKRPLWGWLELLRQASEPMRVAFDRWRPVPLPPRGL